MTTYSAASPRMPSRPTSRGREAAAGVAVRLPSVSRTAVICAALSGPPPLAWSGFEQHQRDLAIGALLVTGVVPVLARDERPHPGAFVCTGNPGMHVLLGLSDDLHLDRRVV